MAILQATNLSITRQQQTLFTIDQLIINEGARIGLVGANGVGKTTLVSLLTGKLTPDSGNITTTLGATVVPQLHTPSTQSGGEQVKAAILAALRDQPAWLILDEPSANLDVDNQEWLINQLNRFKGTLLVISHDRHLLNNVTNETWELANQQLTVFSGNYDAFLADQENRRANQMAAYEARQAKQRKLEIAAKKRLERANRIAKPNPNKHSAAEIQDMKMALNNNKGKMAKTARVINDHADTLAKVERPKSTKSTTIRADQFASLGRHTPVRVTHLQLAAGEKILSKDVSLTINPEERVAITGPNQVGKTTLLRALLANDSNSININSAVRFGYFAQNIAHIDLTTSIWDNIRKTSDQDETTLRTILSEFGFSATMLDCPANMLSGGQRVKLGLVTVLVSNANVLMLDEPTNYLDIPTMNALEAFLSDYPGTVIFVSHDQAFVQNIATRTLTLSKDGLIDPLQTTIHKKSASQRQKEDEDLLAMFRNLD